MAAATDGRYTDTKYLPVKPSLLAADKAITWTAPSLSVGTPLSVEFRIDLCGYCDKYDGGRFNPIDSFQYE